MKIKLMKIYEDAIIPTYAHNGDACMDVYSYGSLILRPNESAKIETGISFEIPVGYEIEIRPRSGLALNNMVTILNSPATVDEGYRGQIYILLINHGEKSVAIEKGMRIAQIQLQKVLRMEFILAEQLSTSSRGEGGFGSTGK